MRMLPSSPTTALLYGLLAVVGVVTTIALTLSGVSLTRAGLVSVLPVTSQQTGVTVCGHGKASARPDQAQLQIGVFATAATAENARSQAAQAMNSVLGALKGNGVADADIQTNYFVIQPQYEYSGTPRQIGYMVSNAVTATVHKVDDVGKIVDAVTTAGGNNVIVSGIQFSNGDPAQALLDAQKNAVADAKRQADQIASSAGASLGAPVAILVGGCGNGSQNPVYSGADKGAPGATTPIQPGQLQYAVDVEVVYALR